MADEQKKGEQQKKAKPAKGDKGHAQVEAKPSPDAPRHAAKERPRLRSRFEKEVAVALMKELELKNPMAVPRLHKIVVTMGVREGMPIGAMVTLRGDRMYEFFDRLVSIVLPRVRDFRGVSTKSFDGRGNYTLGLHDQLIFPEIDYAKVDKLKGMNVTIVTTARSDDQARSLLKHLGMPFRA